MGKKKLIAMISIIVFIVAVAAIGAAAWHYLFGTPNPPLPSSTVTITDSSSSTQQAQGDKVKIDAAAWTVEFATTTAEQTRGLSYRTSLAPDAGMLFIFPGPATQTFWMKDMNFPLDMIWIASDDTVAGFAQDVPPPAPGTMLWNLPIYSSPSDVDKVLEVNAGSVVKYNIKVGDKVTIVPPSA